MKISELQKGDTGIIPMLGKVKIVGIAKRYIKVKQLEFNGIIARVHFACNAATISDLKLELNI